MTDEAKQTPWQFAENWYCEEAVFSSLKRNDGAIPADVRSKEFAAWLTHQYRLAMNKGIEIGMAWGEHVW